MKLYLDTDIFLAVIKNEDRLKNSAIAFFKRQQKEELYTSTTTLLEVMFYAYSNNLNRKTTDVLNLIESMVNEIIPLEKEDVIKGADLCSEYSLSPADGIHVAIAKRFDAIVSTDHKFDAVPGLKKIDFSQS